MQTQAKAKASCPASFLKNTAIHCMQKCDSHFVMVTFPFQVSIPSQLTGVLLSSHALAFCLLGLDVVSPRQVSPGRDSLPGETCQRGRTAEQHAEQAAGSMTGFAGSQGGSHLSRNTIFRPRGTKLGWDGGYTSDEAKCHQHISDGERHYMYRSFDICASIRALFSTEFWQMLQFMYALYASCVVNKVYLRTLRPFGVQIGPPTRSRSGPVCCVCSRQSLLARCSPSSGVSRELCQLVLGSTFVIAASLVGPDSKGWDLVFVCRGCLVRLHAFAPRRGEGF